MAKRKNIGEVYKQYFYKNNEHLKGAEFVEAYKQLVIDAYNKEFIIVDSDNEDVLPENKKTVKNIRKFQERIDHRIYNYVSGLSVKEKKEALESDVIACTTVDYEKLKCAKLNFGEIMDNIGGSMPAYDRITLKLANAFGSNEPTKSSEGVAGCANDLKDVAKEIKSHKPGFFTYLFRRSTYNRRMEEYKDLKLKLECAVIKTFYPIDIERRLNGKEFGFLDFGPKSTFINIDNQYNEIMRNAKELIPDADFKSVYYNKEAEDYKLKNKKYLDSLTEDFKEEVNEKMEVDLGKENEEIKEVDISNDEVKKEDVLIEEPKLK